MRFAEMGDKKLTEVKKAQFLHRFRSWQTFNLADFDNEIDDFRWVEKRGYVGLLHIIGRKMWVLANENSNFLSTLVKEVDSKDDEFRSVGWSDGRKVTIEERDGVEVLKKVIDDNCAAEAAEPDSVERVKVTPMDDSLVN